jgi:hypothetical protein
MVFLSPELIDFTGGLRQLRQSLHGKFLTVNDSKVVHEDFSMIASQCTR